MFGIYLHETNVKTSRLVKTFANKLEALGFMEETVEDFITNKDGEKRGKESLIQEPSSYKSMRWGSLPFGFFKTRNTGESLYRMTVWHKIKKIGYLYNSYEIVRVFSIDLIYLPESLINPEITPNKALETIFYHFDSDEDPDTSEVDLDELYKKQHMENMICDVLPLLRKDMQEIIEDNIDDTIITIQNGCLIVDDDDEENQRHSV
jgi:hypothetical protein